eukprot:CAMPEP_0117522970 /NCGR_PEP_ID=MMETSP0784-20121206/34482_1 /TAXON_ID=39447 /ORGANISM="" /LENGTH=127 /DNA_ID=CAMNT_0005319059 /DNA_START=427 /DNA_END=806 /DNA_ORIENTATION=+
MPSMMADERQADASLVDGPTSLTAPDSASSSTARLLGLVGGELPFLLVEDSVREAFEAALSLDDVMLLKNRTSPGQDRLRSDEELLNSFIASAFPQMMWEAIQLPALPNFSCFISRRTLPASRAAIA